MQWVTTTLYGSSALSIIKIVQRVTLLKNTDCFIFIHQVFIIEVLSFSFSHHPLVIFLCWHLLI
jgi:hypothetical protein